MVAAAVAVAVTEAAAAVTEAAAAVVTAVAAAVAVTARCEHLCVGLLVLSVRGLFL